MSCYTQFNQIKSLTEVNDGSIAGLWLICNKISPLPGCILYSHGQVRKEQGGSHRSRTGLGSLETRGWIWLQLKIVLSHIPSFCSSYSFPNPPCSNLLIQRSPTACIHTLKQPHLLSTNSMPVLSALKQIIAKCHNNFGRQTVALPFYVCMYLDTIHPFKV